MKQGIIFIALLAMASALCAESVYKWRDKNGVVNFSDQPTLGAKQIQIKEPPTDQSAPEPDPNTPAASAPVMPSAGSPPVAASGYNVITVTQPMIDQTIRDNEGKVIVQVTLDPQLRPGDQIQLVMDGQDMGAPQSSTAMTLTNVDRGTHMLAARVVDAAGNTLIESNAVTFYVQRTIVKKPKV